MLLGLPVAAVGERVEPFAANGTARMPGGRSATVAHSSSTSPPSGRVRSAAACLAATGADVVKVEDVVDPTAPGAATPTSSTC